MKNLRFSMKEDVGWSGSASFGGKSFDSVVRVVLRVHQVLKTVNI